MANSYFDDHDEPAPGLCTHCQGQRFDRAQVLRTLRQLRRNLRDTDGRQAVDRALSAAIQTVRTLEIPHLEYEDMTDSVVH
jgi:hypothetical protein